MELDVRKLGVTLRSTSGTMAYAEEIYDSNKSKFQSAINADLEAKDKELDAAIKSVATDLDNVNIPVTGVKSDDKVLTLANKELSTTLSLSYTDNAIKLHGKNDVLISSIDVSEFTRDKFVESATLVETAESGVSIEVPYIKLVFNDASAPVRFSVKKLIDIYTGANLKLSSAYGSTTAQAPASGVSVDAAIKNVATRVGTAESNITALQGKVTTLEGKTYVDSIGGKKGDITLKGGQSANGTINLTIDDKKQISATINGLGTAAYKSDTYFLNKVNAESSSDFATLTASTPSGGTETITIGLVTKAVESALESNDGLATANNVREFVQTTQNIFNDSLNTLQGRVSTNETNISDNSTRITNLSNQVSKEIGDLLNTIINVEQTAYKTVKGTDGQFVNLALSDNDTAKTQTISASVTTAAVKTGGSTNGLATAADIFENCIMSVVADQTEYAEFDEILSSTPTTTPKL